MVIVDLKKCFALLGVVFAMTASGCSDKGVQSAATQMPAPLVEVLTIAQVDAPYTNDYIAQTEGSKAVEIRAQVTGILKERLYNEGELVEQGSVLFLIEPDSYNAALLQARGALAQAQAGVKQAKLNYDRMQNLYKQKAVSEKDFDNAQLSYDTALGQLDSASAAVTEAEIRVGYTSVVAPITGYVSDANYSIGNLVSVSATMPLTVMNQVDPMFVNFSVPSTTMNLIRKLSIQKKLKIDNMTVKVTLEDGTEYPSIGKVTFFDKQVSTLTGDIKARAEFSNPDLMILPGQFMTATLQGFTFINAIIIPQKALMKMGSKSMVIVIDENNVAHYRPITTEINIGNYFLISDGLKAGERIVVEGQNKVMEGGQVRIANSTTPAATK